VDPWSVVKTGAALAIVLGLMGLAAYLAKRFLPAHWSVVGSSSLVRVLSRVPLGGGREVVVIDVSGARLVIGATASQITLLARFEGDALRSEQVGSSESTTNKGAQGRGNDGG